MIFGTFIYGQTIYHECNLLGVLLYDFQISIHDLGTEALLPNIHWAMYRRDISLSALGPIDDTHILVDQGINLSGLLEIDLGTYGRRLFDDDFYITAWRADNPNAKTNVYVRYYHTDYINSDSKHPYLINSIYIPRSSNLLQGDIIEIEQNRWQLISIPIRYGYWNKTTHSHVHDNTTIANIKNYIIDQIEDVYGVSASTMIEVMNTYIGDENKMWNYVSGVTIDSSEHNFPLAYIDDTNVEYCGIWVKSIHSTPFDIRWGVRD